MHFFSLKLKSKISISLFSCFQLGHLLHCFSFVACVICNEKTNQGGFKPTTSSLYKSAGICSGRHVWGEVFFLLTLFFCWLLVDRKEDGGWFWMFWVSSVTLCSNLKPVAKALRGGVTPGWRDEHRMFCVSTKAFEVSCDCMTVPFVSSNFFRLHESLK